MIINTGNNVAGHDIMDYLGVVRGIVVRSTGIARGVTQPFAGFLPTVGRPRAVAFT
jgi:uncharacterized protein YbjQ (UPF0145 family)